MSVLRIELLGLALRDNRPASAGSPPDRFATQPYFHPSTDQMGRSYTFAAGVIDDVWDFDAAAFGMSLGGPEGASVFAAPGTRAA